MRSASARLTPVTRRTAASFVVFALLLAACSSDDGGSDPVATDQAPGTAEAAPADTEAEPSDTATTEPEPTDTAAADDPEWAVTVEASPYIGLAAAVTVTSGEPFRVELTANGPDHTVEVPRTAALATEHVIPLVGMRAESTYVIDARFIDAEGGTVIAVADAAEFTTSALPAWFDEHELTIDKDRAAPGYTIVEFDTLGIPEGAPSSQHLMAFDNDGEVVWYYTNTGASGGCRAHPGRNVQHVLLAVRHS